MNNDIILETKLVGDITGEFYVPSYQRGYRWGEEEVTRLLDDIYQNGRKNYCLQPVVVRRKGTAYELVDGQQRLTTLYLIYRYMKNVFPVFDEPAFSLIYQTREKSADYLKTLDLERQNENIDFWFIGNAYKSIKKWFEQDMQIRILHMFEYLKEQVRIIWYEVGEDEDAISLFTRLNIGKIPLTSAELVKAMFLKRDCADDGNAESVEKKRRNQEIALQWDNMEKELHNDALWYFLSNSVQNKYQTRIDLVLDLIAGKPENTREKYYTFFRFEGMCKESTQENLWRKIQQTFLVLKDWFEDHELYHKIGFLIASDVLTLHDIFELSENQTKADFKARLDDSIKKSVSGNFSEMSYVKQSEYRKITRLLLLFNVESVRQNGEHTQWFPFEKFKYGRGGETIWSLEHIHAQHSEGMKTWDVWVKWIELHIPSVKAVGGENQAELILKMQEAMVNPKLNRSGFEAIQQKVLNLLSVSGGGEYMHSISNLALLNTADNAALSNATFDVKRNEIIRMDKEGQYIPFCTKMVFLKYYTPSEDNQLHFWGQADRIAYVNAINKVLENYLEEPVILEKEAP